MDTGPVEENNPSTPERADLSGYPRLVALQQALSEDHSAEEFEQSLESLLDRLELTRD